MTDVVGLAGVYENGIASSVALCAVGACPYAGNQLAPGSNFLRARGRRPHEGPTFTTVAWHLTLDALRHAGPADASRLGSHGCDAVFLRGAVAPVDGPLLAGVADWAGPFLMSGARPEPALGC